MSPAGTGRPRGRRPAADDTRGSIVLVAREEFAEKGYDATSLRGIARTAGVDPSLLHHYWDGKAALFAETMEISVSPSVVVPRVVDGPPEQVGERAVRAFLSLWDAPERRPQLVALLRSAVTHEAAARSLREFLAGEIFGRIAAGVRGAAPAPPDEALRTGLAASQMLGFAVMRYVVRLPAVADAPAEEVVTLLGPTLQRYLAPGPPGSR